MERLCDEVVQLIFYELAEPGPLTLVSQRFHRFSQDPYVRAHYFLMHYGPTEAMFQAFARGRVLTERVLDILLASGAQLSRYLIQIAMHHYFYTQSHFVKTPWVRNVPLRVFTYFLKIAEELYGEIPRGKGDDDGSIFSTFLKESRLPLAMRNVSWEAIREILEIYHFIPFSAKDPIMAQFPLALAIEPKLLPYAVKNGFYMDGKARYRDFVFRKMFERPAVQGETAPEDIVDNVRELCRLDPTMFVSRTVAAEICMEAKLNDTAYGALKILDKSGELRFELHGLVEDLIKTFIRTRSISSPSSIEILRYLYTDFRSSDPTARLVILITLFINTENLHHGPAAIHAKLEALGLTPMTRKDVYNILVNPFVDRYNLLFDYAKWGVIKDKDGRKGMEKGEIEELVEEVVWRCLELSCKGRFLKKLYEDYSFLHDVIPRIVLENYQISLEDLPPSSDLDACQRFEAKLCQDFTKSANRDSEHAIISEDEDDDDLESDFMEVEDDRGSEDIPKDDVASLGDITQETLTTMIRHDEVLPVRVRRRTHNYPFGGLYADTSGRSPYPIDSLPVARWIKAEFGAKSSVTAVFMTHAVINENTSIVNHYTHFADGNSSSLSATHVPVTFKHFQLLARLGREPNYSLYHEIEAGAEFYFDEGDYLTREKEKKTNSKTVKIERNSSPLEISARSESSPTMSGSKSKKRPRRTVTAVRSYAVPGSDDEAIADGDEMVKHRKPVETSLQKWIYHLGELAKEENRKYKDEKKKIEMGAEPGTKVRVNKNKFFKSLSSHLRALRRTETEKRIKLYGTDMIADDYSDEDDGDVEYKTRPAKRRRL